MIGEIFIFHITLRMKLVSILKSDKPEKKLKAVFENDGRTKTVYFGSSANMDYTRYYKRDGPEIANERKRLYRIRHKKDLETKDFTRPGYLSWFLLWSEPTLEEAIKKYKQRFNL